MDLHALGQFVFVEMTEDGIDDFPLKLIEGIGLGGDSAAVNRIVP